MKIKLLPFQDKFVFSPARFPAFVAAWGTGKSMCGILRALYLSQHIPNNLGLIVRSNFTDLRDSTIKDFEKYTGLKVNEQTKEVKLSNGSQILFRHASELDTLKNINAGFFWIEQAEELDSAEQWFYLQGRLRREGKFRSGWITANTNGHNWVWDLWKDKPHSQDYELIEANTLDNKDNLPTDFMLSLENIPEQVYARFVLNDWNIAEGLVWPEFDPCKHCTLSYTIEDAWKQIIALDHGYTNSTAALFLAENYDGQVIIYNEHYAPQMFVSDHASKIKALEPFYYSMRRIIDPSCRNKIMQKDGIIYSIIDEYSDYGLYFEPGQNGVDAGINRVAEYFKTNRIIIFEDKCPNLVRELKNYKRKVQKPGQQGFKEGPQKIDDHACDALRYAIMARPQLPVRRQYVSPDPAIPCAGDLYKKSITSPYQKWMAA